MKTPHIIAVRIATVLPVSALSVSSISAQACVKDEPVPVVMKIQSAEVKKIDILSPTQAKVVLDFVEVFDTGKAEYERYLKLGYPKISQAAFDAKAPGGIHVANHNKKLRTFYTTSDTKYYAYCPEASSANASGEVSMSLNEFNIVLNNHNASPKAWQKHKKRFGSCYSQNSDLVQVTFSGNAMSGDTISNIRFHWTP